MVYLGMLANTTLRSFTLYIIQVIESAPETPDPYITLGLIYDQMSDRKQAYKCYKEGLKVCPNNLSLLKKVAMYSREHSETDIAYECLCKLIKINPKDDDALLDRYVTINAF